MTKLQRVPLPPGAFHVSSFSESSSLSATSPKHSSLSLDELGRDVTTGITTDETEKTQHWSQAPSSDAPSLGLVLHIVKIQ